MNPDKNFAPSCPVPIRQYPRVLLAHGGGGKLMRDLLEKMFFSAFGAPPAEGRHDAAVLPFPAGRLAFTTDSYVVARWFFQAATSVRWPSTAPSTTWR